MYKGFEMESTLELELIISWVTAVIN